MPERGDGQPWPGLFQLSIPPIVPAISETTLPCYVIEEEEEEYGAFHDTRARSLNTEYPKLKPGFLQHMACTLATETVRMSHPHTPGAAWHGTVPGVIWGKRSV